MYILLNTFWFIWELKYVLFWLYLWQLKEYHVGRFIDHFRTNKGKRLLFSVEQISKLFLLVLLFSGQGLLDLILSVVFLIYLAESVVFLRGILNKSVKKPKITFKTLFLTAVSFAVVIIFLIKTLKLSDSSGTALILGFDILTPIVISIIVLLFQPFFVFLRNNTLREAESKMEKMKSVSGLKVIAITGSYGKTSTKEFLSTILSKKFKVLKTREHQNAEIGIAKCILQDLKPSHQIFIAEVGAYNKGKVKEVCFMLKPKMGIVTGVNEQHLALFGSLDNLLMAEGGGEMASELPEDGILFVNGDNKHCLNLYKRHDGNKKIYSLSNKIIDSDIWADSVTVHRDSISFLALDKFGSLAHFGVKVLGRQNVQNLLGAILIARELGMSFGEISEACENILPKDAGMLLKNGKNGIDIIDSSYSANPDGVFADLDYLSIFSGKKVVIMPCLIELGKKSPQIHEKIGEKLGEICDLLIVTSKDQFTEIKMGAVNAGMAEKNIILCDNPNDIYSIVELFCKAGDAVLLEGRVPARLVELLTEQQSALEK